MTDLWGTGLIEGLPPAVADEPWIRIMDKVYRERHQHEMDAAERIHIYTLIDSQPEEILDVLDGACTLEDAIYKIKRDTRHFAKRQITWFKREKHVTWINKKDYNYDEDKILEVMLESILFFFCTVKVITAE